MWALVTDAAYDSPSYLQGIADEMKGKVSVVKIDTDKYPNIASKYGIKVSPCSTQPDPFELPALLAPNPKV